jgi:hypothetical protein
MRHHSHERESDKKRAWTQLSTYVVALYGVLREPSMVASVLVERRLKNLTLTQQYVVPHVVLDVHTERRSSVALSSRAVLCCASSASDQQVAGDLGAYVKLADAVLGHGQEQAGSGLFVDPVDL